LFQPWANHALLFVFLRPSIEAAMTFTNYRSHSRWWPRILLHTHEGPLKYTELSPQISISISILDLSAWSMKKAKVPAFGWKLEYFFQASVAADRCEVEPGT
jgi:hypothetical protein